MHKKWSNTKLGEEIGEEGFASIEFDESEIIGNENTIGLIDRIIKNALVYCVLSDRTKRRLLPIVKDNVLTNEIEDDNIQKTKVLKHVFIQTVSEPTKLMILEMWGII